MKAIKDSLINDLRDMKIVDAHEHLCTEAIHKAVDYNFYYLMRPYIQFDLYGAGMSGEFLWNVPSSPQEVEKYWKAIAPLWQYVKQGSYARVMRMALKEFWGIDDITDSNYKDIGILLNNTRQDGHYNKILKDKCKIAYILNQSNSYSFEEDYMKGHIQITGGLAATQEIRSFLKNSDLGKIIKLEDYLEYAVKKLKEAKAQGAVLAKFSASSFQCIPNLDLAIGEFETLKVTEEFMAIPNLEAVIAYKMLDQLEELDMVAAFHTGVWDDIRNKSPEHLFTVVQKYPGVTFDIYHMGMPYVRECGFLGKNYPNVYLNLCWSHMVSPEMTIHALGEWLDYVPVNKIFGFGGDFITNPESIWAHLEIARENLAEVFARKIHQGRMDLESARKILELWMYENPARVYKLGEYKK